MGTAGVVVADTIALWLVNAVGYAVAVTEVEVWVEREGMLGGGAGGVEEV